jgi:hypothetical protein
MYYICAKEFGWTIEETRSQPAKYLDWVLAIHGMMKGIESDQE